MLLHVLVSINVIMIVVVYFIKMPPCIMAPVPGFGRNCSMCQKILLWKVFKPDKVLALAIKEFC